MTTKLRVKIVHDPDAGDPFKETETAGTLWIRENMKIGHDEDKPADMLCVLCDSDEDCCECEQDTHFRMKKLPGIWLPTRDAKHLQATGISAYPTGGTGDLKATFFVPRINGPAARLLCMLHQSKRRLITSCPSLTRMRINSSSDTLLAKEP